MVFLFGIVSFFCCYTFFLNGISFYIARHLAAKFGTGLWLSSCMSSLLCVGDSQFELTLFSLYFPWIANYQIVMISFINSNTCRSICCWLCWLLIFVLACFNLGCRIY
jgi:hypothetical protein